MFRKESSPSWARFVTLGLSFLSIWIVKSLNSNASSYSQSSKMYGLNAFVIVGRYSVTNARTSFMWLPRI